MTKSIGPLGLQWKAWAVMLALLGGGTGLGKYVLGAEGLGSPAGRAARALQNAPVAVGAAVADPTDHPMTAREFAAAIAQRDAQVAPATDPSLKAVLEAVSGIKDDVRGIRDDVRTLRSEARADVQALSRRVDELARKP